MNLERLKKARERYAESRRVTSMSDSEQVSFFHSRGWTKSRSGWKKGDAHLMMRDAILLEMTATRIELLAAIDEVLASGGACRHDR